jgi:hypothetical protein
MKNCKFLVPQPSGNEVQQSSVVKYEAIRESLSLKDSTFRKKVIFRLGQCASVVGAQHRPAVDEN